MSCLIVVSGQQHRTQELSGSRTRIGAHPENDLVLQGDPGISRRHCELVVEGDQVLVRDRGSRTGTYVNDSRVESARLAHGDRLRLGQTVVLFVPGEDEARHSLAARRLRDLAVLQEINKTLNSETDHAQLLELIMDTAIRLIHAERGFLILVRGDQLEFRVARNIDYEAVRTPEFKISNQLIRRVVQTGEPVLTSNAQQDLRDMKSIAALAVRAVMCVPLRSRSRIVGTIWLDSQNPDSVFDDPGRDLLMAFSDQAALAIENARLIREAKDKEAILSELRVASRIQLALLPREDPQLPGFEISGRMKTAREVGGDYYDYIQGPRNLFMAIGDVSGKGVPAGLVMVMARSILRSLVGRELRPRDALREANRLLKQDLKPGLFMSLLLGCLDGPSGQLLLSGCGHERPLVYRARERRVERLDVGGLVLGVVDDIGPHLEERRVALAPGDQVLLYTDGVTEAVDPHRQQFGVERLERFLTRTGQLPPQLLVQALLDELELHQAGAEQHDDISVIAVRRA